MSLFEICRGQNRTDGRSQKSGIIPKAINSRASVGLSPKGPSELRQALIQDLIWKRIFFLRRCHQIANSILCGTVNRRVRDQSELLGQFREGVRHDGGND